MELHGKYVFLSEGVRGSLSKQVIAKYDLADDPSRRKYGLGMKEIWEIDPAKHNEGTVTHTMGWPLGSNAGGGSFIYHLENNQVYVGFVVHLNYKNPHLFPYMEFQRFKHHPMVADLLEGGKRVAYGARAITEGGYQSMPKMVARASRLLGCSVGHGQRAAHQGQPQRDAVGQSRGRGGHAAIAAGRSGDELDGYEAEVRNGAIGKDLKKVRNVKPLWSKYGLLASLSVGGFDMWTNTLGFSLLGTLKHGKIGCRGHRSGSDHAPIDYPKPDGKLSFDRLTNVAFSFTNHEESQPAHLTLDDPTCPSRATCRTMPARRAVLPGGCLRICRRRRGHAFQINFQNCVHCKTCDIKDPSQNITWTTPQGGDGPNYPNM